MTLPFFYIQDIESPSLILDEDTSKHVISVLRMKKDDEILLTNGVGKKARGKITDDNRKRCGVDIISVETVETNSKKVSIAISLIKNAARFEWFLEKATEIGVSEIIPLLCTRTEKEKFRFDRMQQILISAMLQSQQCWLPKLHTPSEFKNVVAKSNQLSKFIAHCVEDEKRNLSAMESQESTLILIGPEGDFTHPEITEAINHNFIPVALGETRLRTETAGIVAATLLCIA
jgi:16S rRNA (uracil1498-N3)-methyltransferase